MTHCSPTSEALFHRAGDLFQDGCTMAGALHVLYALRLAGSTADGIPTGLRPFCALVRQYEALLAETRRQALLARTAAYAPYSGFAVGAALLAEDGTIYSGCNVESSSYGLTICAERTALVTAIAQGKRRITAVVVATQSSPPASPCGTCRQMLYEFAPDAVVVMVNPEGEERWSVMQSLLPDAFSSRSLPSHRSQAPSNR